MHNQQKKLFGAYLTYSLTLKKAPLYFPEMSVNFYWSTLFYIPKDNTLYPNGTLYVPTGLLLFP
jgi:hypothetical protein